MLTQEQRIKNGRARYAQLLLRQQYREFAVLSAAELIELDNLKKRFAAGELGAIGRPGETTEDQGHR